MLVTDKKYYMEKDLVPNLDFLLERNKKGWDNVLILDGEERSGKTTLGKQIGYYLNFKKKKNFTVDNIHFCPEEMFDYAMEQRQEVIMWDEAALGAMSEDRYKQSQQLIIKMLMTAGKYNHNYIFIIPKIRKLSDYIAEDRSIALLRVKSLNNIDRGFFDLFGKKKKNLISQFERKKQKYFIKRDMRGRFFSYENTDKEVIDLAAYEQKKDNAIKSIINQDKKKKSYQIYFKKLVEHIKKNKLMTYKEVAGLIDKDASFISRLARETE